MTNVKSRFHLQDALRGIAAVLVVLWHFRDFFGDLDFPESFLAVDLFFVLSGFVIAKSYQSSLEQGLGTARFMLLRWIRLGPSYYFALFVRLVTCAAIFLAAFLGYKPLPPGMSGPWSDYAWATAFGLFMLPDILTGTLYPFNWPVWSLFFELQANLVYGLFHKMLEQEFLSYVLLISAIALILCELKYGIQGGGALWKSFIVGTARTTYSFFCGVFIHHIVASRKLIESFGLRRFPPVYALVIVVAALCIKPAASFRIVYEMAVILFVFPLAVFLALFSNPRTWWGVSAAKFLGDISYPIYVLQMPMFAIFRYVDEEFLHLDVRSHAPWLELGVLVTLILFCYLVEKFMDAPLRRRLMTRVEPIYQHGARSGLPDNNDATAVL